MKISKNDIITLSDDNKYLVISKAEYENNNYYFLVDIINNSNIKFVAILNDNIIEVDNNVIMDNIFQLMIVDLGKSTKNH